MILALVFPGNIPAIFMLGVVAGLQYALLAMGIVLVYKAGRYFNLAHGQLGLAGAALLGSLVAVHGWPYWPTLVLCLALGGVIGVVVEQLVIRRLFNAPRLVLLLATLAVSQVLFAIGYAVGPEPVELSQAGGFPVPFTFSWRIGMLRLSASQILTLLLTPLLCAGLAAFFTRTSAGRAIRAVSSNADAARLAGISVRTVSRTVWLLAGTLSAVAAVLVAPDASAFDLGVTGPSLLLRALAAALLGGLVSLPGAFVAAVGIGIAEQTVGWHAGQPAADLAVLVIILVAVVVRARTLARVAPPDEWLPEPSTPPLSERLRGIHGVQHLGRYTWAALATVAVVVPLLPGFRTQSRAQLMVILVGFCLVGLSFTVLTGWAGQVSLGHFALAGVGAYGAAWANDREWGLLMVLAAAGVAAAVGGVVVGLPALRYKGMTLVVTTLGFAVVSQSWLFPEHFGSGGVGLADMARPRLVGGVRLESMRAAYYVALLVLAGVVAALYAFKRTGAYRRLVAVRDNEDAAMAHGQTPWAARLSALLVSGFVVGLGGAVWAMGQRSWSAATFEPSMSLIVLSMAVVGGIRTVKGGVVGALAVWAWPLLVPGQNTVVVRAVCSGLLLLVVVLFKPAGAAGLLDSLRARWLAWLERGLPPTPFGPDLDAAPLEVDGLRVRFGGLVAVDGVSLRVDRGEIVGLIGGNGAGKSTAMNCISGHVTAEAGSVRIFGRNVAGIPAEFRTHLATARSFQAAMLYPGLTVVETVMMAIEHSDRSGATGSLVAAPWVLAGERRKKARAVAALEVVGLAPYSHLKVSELSTGMRRLCDLAGVLAARPRLVLLDEPTAGIAQREVESFARLIRSLRDDHGCSVLLIEHDMPLLMSVCDRVYALESGRVVASGLPDEVRHDPAVVAGYLGTNSAAVNRSGPVRRTRSRTRMKETVA